MNNELFDYIAAAPTAYHACECTGDILVKAGYTAKALYQIQRFYYAFYDSYVYLNYYFAYLYV